MLAIRASLLYMKPMLRARALRPDDALIRDSSAAGVRFTLNRDYASALGKVEGEPGVDRLAQRADAVREALVALDIASRPEVEKVYMGEAAYFHLYGRKKQTKENCDVVGILSGQRGAVLGEGKGTDILKSLRQLTASVRALQEARPGEIVRSSMIVTPLPAYLECRAGLATVSQALGQWTMSAPQPTNRYDRILDEANRIGLDPRYDYLIAPNDSFGNATGLGLAASRTGDSFLYSNRAWDGTNLASIWGPIRKLTLTGPNTSIVSLTVIS